MQFERVALGAMITRFPDEKVLIVTLSNLENSQIIRANNDLAAIVLGEKYEIPKVRTAIKVDRTILNTYVGEYEDRPGRITRIFVDHDTLMLQLANTGIGKFDPIPMSAESDREFFDPLHDTQVAFVKDAGGQVIEMVLRIDGREFHAKKIK